MSSAARSYMASYNGHTGLEAGASGNKRAKTTAERPSSWNMDPRWRKGLTSGALTTDHRIEAGALTPHHARAVVYTGGNNQTTTGLSTGAMIGITCGSIVGSAVLLLLVIWLLRRRPWVGLCSRSKKGARGGETGGAGQSQRRENNGEAARTRGGVYQQPRSGRFASRWHARQSQTLSALWNPVTATTEVAMGTSPRIAHDEFAEAAELENGDAAAAAIAEGADEVLPSGRVIKTPSNLWFAQHTPPARPRAAMRKPWMEKGRQGEQKETQVQSPLVREVRRSTSRTTAGRSTPDTDVLFESSFYGAGDEGPPPSLPRTLNAVPPSLPQPYSGVHISSLDDTPCKGYETSGTKVLRRRSVELPAWAYMALEALALDEDDRR